MTFIQLVLFFLALNMVPADIDSFVLQSGEENFTLTRQGEEMNSWQIAEEGEKDGSDSVSINGSNMQVSYRGMTTINFMQQYVEIPADMKWGETESIMLKPLTPPSPIAISREENEIRITHKHDKHPFNANILWGAELKTAAKKGQE